MSSPACAAFKIYAPRRQAHVSMRVSAWCALLRYSKSSRTVKHSFLPARISPFRCEEESAEAEHNAAVFADRV